MRTLFLLLLSCLPCLAQFGVEQPMFALSSTASPIPTGDLKLWLKPESLSGTNDQRITVWVDSSPYLNHGTNSFGSSPYLSSTNAFKGYSSARFDASGSTFLTFKTNYGLSMLRNVPGATLYMVLTPNGSAGMYPFYVKDNSGSSLRLGPNGGSFFYRFIGKSKDADGDVIGSFSPGQGPTDTSKFFLLNCVVSYTGRTIAFFTNGVSLHSQGSMGWTAGNTSDTDSGVSDPNILGSATYAGRIVEVLLYSTNHAQVDRLQVENYLTNKYGTFPTW